MRAGCSNHIPTDAAGKLHDDATMDRLVAALSDVWSRRGFRAAS
jgi:hypothetical protein